MALIPGIAVQLGGQEFTIPCFSFAVARKVDETGIARLALGQQEGTQDERYQAILEFIRLALSRNYPDITKESLEALLDDNFAQDAVRAILKVNKMDRRPGASPGEQGPRPVAHGDGAALHGPEVVAQPA
jgi:hypothetical protein